MSDSDINSASDNNFVKADPQTGFLLEFKTLGLNNVELDIDLYKDLDSSNIKKISLVDIVFHHSK